MAATQAILNLHFDQLPPLIQDLIRIMGLDDTLALVEQYGGCVVHVPVNEAAIEGHYLSSTISTKGLKALIAEYQGEDINTPKAYRAILAARNTRLKQDRQRGMTIRQLAQRYQLTERRIYDIVGMEINEQQLDLFGD
jgi:Mor family transcriptional regulator